MKVIEDLIADPGNFSLYTDSVSDIQNSLKECVGLSKGEWNILSNGKLPTRFKKNKKANDCLAYALYNLLGTPLTYKLGKKYWNTLIKSQLNA